MRQPLLALNTSSIEAVVEHRHRTAAVRDSHRVADLEVEVGDRTVAGPVAVRIVAVHHTGLAEVADHSRLADHMEADLVVEHRSLAEVVDHIGLEELVLHNHLVHHCLAPYVSSRPWCHSLDQSRRG